MCPENLPKSLLCFGLHTGNVMLVPTALLWLIVCYSASSLGEEIVPRGPNFTIEPPSKVEFSNSSGTVVPCSADGFPRPMLNWVRSDGERIQDIPRLRYIRHDGSLVFSPFPSDEYRADIHGALYRCEASNTVGIIGSRDVHVRSVIIQEYDIQLFDEFVLNGNTAVLHCPIPSYVADYVRVTAWERMDGFQVTSSLVSGKYGMLDDGDLYIKDVSEHDTMHSFRCLTENSVTKEKRVSRNYARIILSETRHNQAPRISRRTSRITTRTGSRITLPCLAQGLPVPSYRWRKHLGNDLVLPALQSAERQDGGILLFDPISPVNAGRYTCYVSNTMGEDKMDTEIVIEEPVSVAIVPKVARADIGKNTSFNCSVTGGPMDTIIWRKDMRVLPPNPRLTHPSPGVLHIARTSRQDAGMYQCFAQRDQAVAQASAQLLIGDVPPKFKITFAEKIIRSGSFISLMCVALGNPSPQMKWTMDNIWTLSTRPGVLVTTYLSNQGDVFSYVNISSVDVTDSGVYTCEAFNDAGRVIHSRRLNVLGNLFIRPVSNLSALAGQEFSVLCPFGGYPFDNIVWKRDGRQLPVNQRQKVFPNGTLQIMEMQPGVDDGLYSCEVTYGQGIPAFRTFSIAIKTKPQISNFSFPGNLHEGMRTAVTCIVLAGDPPVTTRWLKDGQPLMEEDLDASVLHAGGGFVSTLTINTLAHKHNGNYTCMATNEVGTGSWSTKLTVKVPPRWVLEPQDTSAISGRGSRIDCQADGVPQPHVRWKMSSSEPTDDFKTIVSSSHIHILVNGSLNFRSIEQRDAGLYLCEANNGIGAGLSTVVRLTVHSPPKFDTKFLMLTARRGEKVHLKCNSLGDAPMTFSWRKNGIPIDPFTKPRYSQEAEDLAGGAGTRLIIDKAEREDSASFTCTAINDFGEDSINIQLTVQDVPDAPQNLEIHDVSSRSIRLTWNRPFDGNLPVLRYITSWRTIEEQSTGGPLTVPGDETTLIIRGLKPKTRYFFRVRCENVLGDSQFGAEVAITTLEEPPREPPTSLKAIPVSSRSVNITWQKPLKNDGVGSIEGYYVGFKTKGGPEPYTFKSVILTESLTQHFELRNLNRFTEYSIVVQPFNSRGAGPPSEEVHTRTLEFDAPNIPLIKSYYTTSKTIEMSWEINVTPDSPVSGYMIYYRMDGNNWQEIRLRGDHSKYQLQDLQCGTKYYCNIAAYNAAGRGNNSEVITVKTDGNAPIAPDKRFLLSLNYTTLTVNLNSWHDGGCPIRFFVVQYRASGHSDWTLVSNNIVPEQQNISVTDLIPGTWYSLLMTARNDASATDAEYLFATMTATGEFPPRPSEVSESNSIYRHFLITIPVASSVVVLIVVLAVVCYITRRRTSGRRTFTSDVADGNESVKPDSMPLSSTYETGQEPAYFPAPYAASRVPGYNRETCGHPGMGNPQNMGTFGSSRSGYTYDIPYPPRKMEKNEPCYESPMLYFPSYTKDLNSHLVSNYKGPHKTRRSLSWKSIEDSLSSGESDDGHIPQTQVIRPLKDDSRESETECDRIWKSLEECKYEVNKKWAEHAVSILS